MGLFNFLSRTAETARSVKEAIPERPRYPLGLSPRDTHGPVVQEGPTAGYNRARNQDGQWRRKHIHRPK